jgi:hypothetical protein
MLADVLGRTIGYEPIGLLRYRRELRAQHLPSDYVRVQLVIQLVARLGRAATTTDRAGRPAGSADLLHGRVPQQQLAHPFGAEVDGGLRGLPRTGRGDHGAQPVLVVGHPVAG